MKIIRTTIKGLEIEAGDLLEWKSGNEYIKFIVIISNNKCLKGISIIDNRCVNTTNPYELHFVNFDNEFIERLSLLSKAEDMQESMLK